MTADARPAVLKDIYTADDLVNTIQRVVGG
jgi:hypothetical protein